jgi:uncharacterized protein (DUF952 family)
MTLIHHLAEPADWDEAVRTGSYRISTRGRILEQEGFIHAAGDDQWQLVRRRFYADLQTDLVLLTFDPDALTVPVRWEVGDPATGERFPHLYGPLDVDAVVATRVLPPPHG